MWVIFPLVAAIVAAGWAFKRGELPDSIFGYALGTALIVALVVGLVGIIA